MTTPPDAGKEEVKLLPCPFCNGEAFVDFVHDHPNHYYFVLCGTHRCPCNGEAWTSKMTHQEAIKAWNTRAPAKPTDEVKL